MVVIVVAVLLVVPARGAEAGLALEPACEVAGVGKAGLLRCLMDEEAGGEGTAGALQPQGIALLAQGQAGGLADFAVEVIGLIADFGGQFENGCRVVGLGFEQGEEFFDEVRLRRRCARCEAKGAELDFQDGEGF